MPVIESARPYPWPYHGRFNARTTALVIAVDDPPVGEALARLGAVAQRCRNEGVLIVQLTRPAGAVLPFASDLTLTRTRFSGFLGTTLDLDLRDRGRTDLLIAGFPLELGADCTMREANDLGYECLLIEDACTAATADTYAGAVRSVQMSGGIFGAVATAHEVLTLLGHS